MVALLPRVGIVVESSRRWSPKGWKSAPNYDIGLGRAIASRMIPSLRPPNPDDICAAPVASPRVIEQSIRTNVVIQVYEYTWPYLSGGVLPPLQFCEMANRYSLAIRNAKVIERMTQLFPSAQFKLGSSIRVYWSMIWTRSSIMRTHF